MEKQPDEGASARNRGTIQGAAVNHSESGNLLEMGTTLESDLLEIFHVQQHLLYQNTLHCWPDRDHIQDVAMKFRGSVADPMPMEEAICT
jgi:hypothetical protein